MEQQNQIQEIVEAAILNLRQVAEVNTIIGQPILTSMGSDDFARKSGYARLCRGRRRIRKQRKDT